jgi:hypothetical protein
MSRTARTVVAGLVTAGVLTLGAGVAYAAEPGDGHHDDSSNGSSSRDADAPEDAPSTDATTQDAGGGLPGAEVVGGLLGSLPIGL